MSTCASTWKAIYARANEPHSANRTSATVAPLLLLRFAAEVHQLESHVLRDAPPISPTTAFGGGSFAVGQTFSFMSPAACAGGGGTYYSGPPRCAAKAAVLNAKKVVASLSSKGRGDAEAQKLLSVGSSAVRSSSISQSTAFSSLSIALPGPSQQKVGESLHQDPVVSVSPQTVKDRHIDPTFLGDRSSLVMVFDVLLYCAHAESLQSLYKVPENLRAVMSFGQTGAGIIDENGQPHCLGTAKLPAIPTWRTFSSICVLDAAVALLGAGTSKELYVSGVIDPAEQPSKSPGYHPGSMTNNEVGQGKESLTHRGSRIGRANSLTSVSGQNEVGGGTTLKRIAQDVAAISGSRTRLLYRRAKDGRIFAASPTMLKHAPTHGVFPHKKIIYFTASLSDGVFFIEGDDNRLLKCSCGKSSGASTPRTVTPLTGRAISVVASGYHFILAADTAGRLLGYGRNEKGQLGLGQTNATVYGESKTFVPVPGLYDNHFVVSIATGRQHAVVLTSEGAVFAAGDCQYGQTGILSTNFNCLFTFHVVPLPGPCAGISCGPFSTTFVLRTGEVYVCGANHHGQLLGDPIPELVKVPTKCPVVSLVYGFGNPSNVDCEGSPDVPGSPLLKKDKKAPPVDEKQGSGSCCCSVS